MCSNPVKHNEILERRLKWRVLRIHAFRTGKKNLYQSQMTVNLYSGIMRSKLKSRSTNKITATITVLHTIRLAELHLHDIIGKFALLRNQLKLHSPSEQT
jgi:hypothetical protein